MWPKGRIALITEKIKHVLAPLGGTPGAISPVAPHSRFHPSKFGFGEVIMEKPVHDHLK